MKPLQYFADIERGVRRRLEADRAYSGFLVENPWHPDWRTEWRRDEPYDLDELNDALFAHDKRPDPSFKEATGTGRNCDLFDALRQLAYQDVLRFKREGTPERWQEHFEGKAHGLNVFALPLPDSEARSIARSVAKWTWGHFDVQTFAAIQAKRGAKGAAKTNVIRWADHETPQALGLTRRQSERQRRYRRRLAVAGGALVPQAGGLP